MSLSFIRNDKDNFKTTSTVYEVFDDNELLTSIDEIASPTNANYFALALLKITKKYCNDEILEKTFNKIYHYADMGLCSRYDFAMAIQDNVFEHGYTKNITNIKPCRKYIFHTPAIRPYYTVLDTNETIENFPFIKLNYWRDNLNEEIKKYFK